MSEPKRQAAIAAVYDALHKDKLGAHWLWCVIEKIAAGQSEADAMREFGYYERAAAQPEAVAWNDTQQASLNDWFLSLPEGRQKVLADDKWMLAGAAFLAGQQVATPPSAATPEPSDAERYRYLRDFYSPPIDELWDNMDCALAHGGEELDALIDATIRATKGGKL